MIFYNLQAPFSITYIRIRHHSVREIYNTEEIEVKCLEIENMTADILIKALNTKL